MNGFVLEKLEEEKQDNEQNNKGSTTPYESIDLLAVPLILLPSDASATCAHTYWYVRMEHWLGRRLRVELACKSCARPP